jgi:hypothetical protein
MTGRPVRGSMPIRYSSAAALAVGDAARRRRNSETLRPSRRASSGSGQPLGPRL